MRKKVLLILLALVLAISIVAVGCPASSTPTETSTPIPEEPIVIRMACDNTPVEPFVMMLTELETTIPEVTDGRVKFEIYPGGTLYTVTDALPLLQYGDLEMSTYGQPTSFIIPEWDVLSADPSLFLFQSVDHFKRFQDTDTYSRLLARMEAMGIKPLTAAYLWGTENFYNNKRPIEKLEDFQGIKFNGDTPLTNEALAMLGVMTVTVTIPEVPTALETGMVDGMVCAFAVQAFIPFNELLPYVTTTGAPCLPLGIAVSTEWWDTVPPDLQQTLQPMFEDTMVRWEQGNWVAEAEQFAIYRETPGTTVTVMSDEEKARCREALQSLYDELKEDPNIHDILEGVEATR